MNLILFLATIAVAFVVVRIGAVAFELTGMERSQARFQALSCFSGTGFTTTEAEMITGHPKRRRIATYLMILGNAGLVTLIATFANSIRPVLVMERFRFLEIPLPVPAYLAPYINILIIISGVYVIYRVLVKSTWSDRLMKKVRQRIVEKEIISPENVIEQLLAPEGFGLSQFELPQGHPLIGTTLQASNLKEQGILVLMLKRGEAVLPNPGGDTSFLQEDRVFCFGKLSRIREFALPT